MNLKGKTVIVTGSSRGIGFAIAKAFAAKGANIVINDIKIPDETIEEIKSFGVDCIGIVADISDFEQAENLVKGAKEKFGTVDVLVNNAGITRDGLLLRMKEKDFDDVIRINLKGTFNMTKHASKIMLKQRRGAIINLSSVVGLMGNVGQLNYSASKAGVLGITKSAARELGQRGITCNAIAPGFIKTPMTDVLNEDVKNAMLAQIPLGRQGLPEDVAKVAVFFAENDYITGQVVNCDGGMVMQ
ncbi:MAG: 3-oxoacyl-[acyl-carrier-protein] reductase [Clostridiales bacterium]|nr:3-oxoacyl-[acyl-carrier-protein] reductase [Clostridiales bacterium]